MARQQQRHALVFVQLQVHNFRVVSAGRRFVLSWRASPHTLDSQLS